MSKNKISDSFDDLLRRTVIQYYASSASHVIYNQQSWTAVQENLEQTHQLRQKKQNLQTIVLIIITLAVSGTVMFKFYESNYPFPISKWPEDIQKISDRVK
jgi:cytochrome b subunit of formate dehydrogenase